MKKNLVTVAVSASFLASAVGLVHAGDERERAEGSGLADARIQHVLLVSIDGMHALDVENYIQAHPRSALAELTSHAVRYTSASTSRPSDSFPGLLSIVTGGSPASTGVFYDVSWDRTQYAPDNTTCKGKPGNATTYDESIDLIDENGKDLDRIDPTKLPNARNAKGECVRVYPHDFLRVNTIFEVVKATGRRTAWADKHPAYDLVSGPSGKGVDDLYTPEITSPVDGGFDATVSVVCTADNDEKKVEAVINEIRGYDHSGTRKLGVPALFGLNFQAVSVGQKVAKDNRDGSCAAANGIFANPRGGYVDGAGRPGEVLAYGLSRTDAALGRIVAALKQQHLYEQTAIVITAKHGQAPIDPVKTNKPGHLQDLVAALGSNSPAAHAIAAAAVTDDDVALVWLQDQSQTASVAEFLRTNSAALNIQEVLAGESLKLRFNDPLEDSRTPDLIVQPNFGTIFTASAKKIAEHGGFSDDDTNVALLVSNPSIHVRVVKSPVQTTQIAPTILQAFDLDGRSLDAVRREHTPLLPGLGFRNKD